MTSALARLSLVGATTLAAALIAATGASLVWPAHAAAPGASLADPTRPPGLTVPAAAPARAASASRATAARPPAAAPPQLQAVFVPRTGAASAIVDGQLVRLGDKLGERVVVTIDNQGLIVRTATGSERLWLLGGTLKQPPGSITASRSTTYLPSPQPLAARGDARASAEPSPVPATGAALTAAAALSLAETTHD